jgi:LacI family transcriptional regulator
VPTVTLLANELGVARSTISRAFTRPELLRPETVEKVLKAAERLGYAPNHTARALSTGRNGNIALVVPDIANPFFPPLIRAAQARADKADVCVLLGDSAEDRRQEQRLIVRFAPQVDGFVLAASRLGQSTLLSFLARRPLVLINRDVPGIHRVLTDSRRGVHEAVEHLYHLGHRSLAYVGGPSGSWAERHRRAAIVHACTRHGMTLTTLRATPATYEGGVDSVHELLQHGVTAALAYDDVVAHGILAGMAGQGVTVPTDFSLVGCDDILAATTYPALTTISLRCAEAGEIAVSALLDSLNGTKVTADRQVLDSHLVVRSTTAVAPVRAPALR